MLIVLLLSHSITQHSHKIQEWTDCASHWKVKVLFAQSCPTLLQPLAVAPARFLCPWNSPGKNIGVGSHSLLQGIFLDSGIKPGSPALQTDSLPSEPPGGKELGKFFSDTPREGCTFSFAQPCTLVSLPPPVSGCTVWLFNPLASILHPALPAALYLQGLAKLTSDIIQKVLNEHVSNGGVCFQLNFKQKLFNKVI